MPDSPDYQKYLPGSNRFSLQDLGELAARLGSPSIYDRRGEVVFAYQFEHGFAGMTGSGTLDATRPFIGPYCLKLVTAVGVGQEVYEDYTLPIFGTQNAGIEFAFSASGNMTRFRVSMQYQITDNVSLIRVDFDIPNHKITIYSASGNYDLPGYVVDYQPDPGPYHVMKVVGDFVNYKYVRIIIDGREFDISHLRLVDDGDIGKGLAYVQFGVINDNVHAANGRVGFYIVTANEP